jgi:hypothetical protein
MVELAGVVGCFDSITACEIFTGSTNVKQQIILLHKLSTTTPDQVTAHETKQ